MIPRISQRSLHWLASFVGAFSLAVVTAASIGAPIANADTKTSPAQVRPATACGVYNWKGSKAAFIADGHVYYPGQTAGCRGRFHTTGKYKAWYVPSGGYKEVVLFGTTYTELGLASSFVTVDVH